MGNLLYGLGLEIPFEDRALAHLQLVITAKLRRGESFVFSWRDEASGGRNTIWLDRAVPLQFSYDGGKMPAINRLWIDELAVSASSAQGLFLTPEPMPDDR